MSEKAFILDENGILPKLSIQSFQLQQATPASRLKIDTPKMASTSKFALQSAKQSLYYVCFYHITTRIMTKQDLVNGAAQAAGVTKKAAQEVLDAVLAHITSSLKKGDSVTITGFGTFRVSKRAARTGVNPRNPSEKIKIPAMKVPAFKAGKSLKDAVR